MYRRRVLLFARSARDGRDDDLFDLSVESPDDRHRASFPSAAVCGYILRRKFYPRECKTVPKSPASLKTFAPAAAAAALLALLCVPAPAGRAQVQDESHQRPRRVSPAPTPAQ